MKKTLTVEELHPFLRQYHAAFQRDVSNDLGHIYFSRPTGKWILVQRKGDKVTASFHDDCPCDKI